MRARLLSVLGVAALGAVSLLPGATATTAARPGDQQRTTVQLGIVAYTALSWPLYAAMAIGSLEQEALNLDVAVMGSAPQVSTALVGGSLDVGLAAMDIHIRAVENGGSLAWFMTEFANPLYRLVARQGINSYADLRGRTIIVDSPNGITFYLTRRMLAQAGLGPDDYNFLFAGGTPERLAALQAGGVDAAILIQPFDFAALRQGYRDLGNSKEVVPAFEFVGYTVRPDWGRANDGTIGRLIRGYLAGQRWLYDPANRERAIEVLSDRTRLSTDDSRATYDLYVERERSFPVGGRINLAGVQAVLDALVDLGALTTPTPPPSKYVDPSYVDRYGQ